jgi:hypothetical protein
MRIFAKSFLVVIAAVFFLTSCGGGSEVCDCLSVQVSMMKEAKSFNFDIEKIKGLDGKYKAEIEKCEKLSEGKSDDDKKKMAEEGSACGSFKEFEALQKEMIESMIKGVGDEVEDNTEEPTEEPTDEEEPAEDHGDDHH